MNLKTSQTSSRLAAHARETRADFIRAHALTGRIRAEEEHNRLSEKQLEQAQEAWKAQPERFSRFYRERRAEIAPAGSIQIYSPLSGDGGAQITGTLRGSGKGAAVYIDSRVSDSVQDADVRKLLDDYTKISLPRLHALFGRESDIDGNGVILIFLSSSEKIGADVVGFFRPADMLPDGAVAGVRSNEAEIIYARVPGSGTSAELANATVAHESFHLINFAVKSLPAFRNSNGNSLVTERLFLNEGLAHLAEELTGWGIDTPLITKIYLDCMQYTSIAGSGSADADSPCAVAAAGGDSLPRRGAAMLFLLYMFQQMGGAKYSETDAGDLSGTGIAFLRSLNTSAVSGIPNLEQASDRSFFSWYGDFAATLALDHTGQVDDPRYNFDAETTDSFSGLTRNIRLRGVRKDETGYDLALDGPAISEELSAADGTSVDGAIYLSGARALQLTVPAGMEFTLSVQGNRQLALGLTLVRTP